MIKSINPYILNSLKLSRLTITRGITLGYFFVLCTAFRPFTIEGKNILLFAYAALGVGFLLLLNYRSMPKIREWLLSLILFYLIGAALLNLKSSQPLSLVYSAFFIVSFLIYVPFMQQSLQVDGYRRLLKTVFIIYFVGLIVGQVYVYGNFFTAFPNQTGNLTHGAWGTLIESGIYRYYSLSSEPSYAAFIVITLYYSYIKLDTQKGSLFKGENLYLFIMLVYMILFFQSAYGIILLALILMGYIGFTKTSVLIYFLSLCVGLIVVMAGIEFGPVTRIIKIIENIDLTNLHGLSSIDFSVYFRIAPLIHYIRESSIMDISFYIGHGAAASRKFVVPETYLAYQGDFLGGFIPSFFYDYGIIGAGLLLLFVWRLLPGVFSIPTAIVALVLFNANINTQLFWIILTCLAINKHFLLGYKRREKVFAEHKSV